MKRIQYLALLLSLLMLFSACGGKNSGSSEPPSAEAPASLPAQTDPETTEPLQTEPDPETEPPQTEPEPETDPIQTVPELPVDPSGTDRPELRFEPLSEPVQARDYEQILSFFLAEDYELRYDFHSRSRTEEGGDEPVYAAELEDTSAVLPIPGVEKGGKAKTDGDRIYLIDSCSLIIQTAAGANSEQLSCTEVDFGSGNNAGRLIELYVSEGRAAVVYEISAYGTDENGNWFDRSETHAAILDVSDPAAPVLLYDCGVDGRWMTSRLADGTLYLIANHYLLSCSENMSPEELVPNIRTASGSVPMDADRIWLCANPRRVGYTAVLGLSLADCAVTDALAFTDVSDWFCMDADGMYLARDVWSWTASEPYTEGVYTVVDYADRCQTECKRLVRTAAGILEPGAACFVEGSPACLYGLSPRDGLLRLATREDRGAYSSYTDENQGWSIDRPGGSEICNRLTVLDRDLNEVGSLTHFAADDSIYLCGYAGNSGWMMTYSEPEAFFPLNLADPTALTVGEPVMLSMEGWILRPYTDTLVLGLAETEKGMEVMIYDTAGDGFAKAAAAVSLPSVYTDAISFPASIWQDPETGRIGFPTRLEGKYGYALCRYTSDGLEAVGVTALDYLPSDANTLAVDGLIYICSPGGTYVVDPETGELLTTISNAVG